MIVGSVAGAIAVIVVAVVLIKLAVQSVTIETMPLRARLCDTRVTPYGEYQLVTSSPDVLEVDLNTLDNNELTATQIAWDETEIRGYVPPTTLDRSYFPGRPESNMGQLFEFTVTRDKLHDNVRALHGAKLLRSDPNIQPCTVGPTAKR